MEKKNECSYRIAEAALLSVSLHELFHSIHSTIASYMPAVNLSFTLVDERSSMLTFPYWAHEADPAPPSRPLGKGMPEYVLHSGKAERFTGLQVRELKAQWCIEDTGAIADESIWVPLQLRGKSIGVLSLLNCTDRVVYTHDDVEFLSGVSGHIAMAIQNKQKEEQLQTSEAKFRSLFEHVPDGVYQTTPEGKIITANPALVMMLGYSSEEEFLNLNSAGDLYVNTLDRSHWASILETTGELRNVELRLKKKDGEEITVLENAHAVRGSSGELLYHEGTLTDITHLKHYERELEVQKVYFEQLFHTAPEAIVILDNEDRVLRINKEFARLFGYELEEIKLRPINELIVPPEMKEESYIITKSVAYGTVINMETIRQKKDGTPLHVSILGTPIFTESGQVGVYGIYRDITERIQRESERDHLIMEIQQALLKVKTLSGLLPICASCKKVRDDHGYWNQIEVYVSEHTEADFTHGICPDCAKKMIEDFPRR